MSSTNVTLSPVDAWFFRDSRPYGKDDSKQAGVKSLFPPHATTVVGALRAALARGNGWDGRSPWGQKQIEVLGDGYEDLGALGFFGPYLLREGGGGQIEPLFAAPLNLLGEKVPDDQASKPVWTPRTLLRPADEGIQCDLGDDVRLPLPDEPRDGLKEARGVWVTRDGMTAVLRGDVPRVDDCVGSGQLWKHEPRIGLERDDDSRTTGDGALYSPSYVRPAHNVSVGVSIRGLPDAWKMPERTPFGGEGRLADIDAIETIELPQAPADTIRSSRRLSVTFLTPARLPNAEPGEHVAPGRPLPDFYGPLAGCTLVSACIGKPVFIGGWNSLERRPLDLEPYLPAGSTLFLEADDARLDEAIDAHATKIGARTAYGFGQVVVGTW